MSTVDTVNELYTDVGKGFISGPIGLGVRVPLIAISPWSKGGFVNSQVFDHTSIIRFLEKSFDLIVPNITPWRCAVCGDLTSIFDFATPNHRKIRLPSTAGYMPPDVTTDPNADTDHPSYPISLTNVLLGVPAQESGMRPERALPYELNVRANANFKNRKFSVQFANTGEATAVFQVRSGNRSEMPRSYTVEEGKFLTDVWGVSSRYDLSVYGPNGFFCSFKGGVDAHSGHASLDVRTEYETDDQGGIKLRLVNTGLNTVAISVRDAYTGEDVKALLAPREDFDKEWSLQEFFGWYDLIIRVDSDPSFEYRLAGHVETGRDSMSDPAIGGHVLKA